ncbi:MAG: segregation/condensation protein A [Candidatus Thermoplasmatota archaeon]|nr:segregation/condensation protein A [Candidatus Thermoplasmatota archaeon]
MQQSKLVDTEVINHLLFHKSLIDEKDDASRINYYVDLLQKTNEGEHVTMENPFDRSIAIAFELVMRNHLNPWDIDLVSFSTMYLKRAKEEKIDLITAGRIIYMAWKVLKLQSDNLVVTMEAQQKQEEQPFGWEDMPTSIWDNLDDYSYTNLILKNPEPPLVEPLRRNAQRKVTLIELLDAFNQVRKESEEYQLLEQQRQEERNRIALLARKHMVGTAHEDHIEEDVMTVWQKIKKHPNKTMTLQELCGKKKDKEELIKIFVSILFLAYDNKITVYQQKFPYGKIFIKNIGYT